MTRLCITGILLLVTFAFFAVSGCDKEKITESTEYIHDIEYVELPPDTVLITDTVFVGGSDTVNFTDTLYIYDTTFTHDTIVTVITDTVLTSQCAPNEYLALSALQYYSDPLVLDLIYQELAKNNFSDEQKWKLIKISIDKYDLPVNIFVEKIMAD